MALATGRVELVGRELETCSGRVGPHEKHAAAKEVS